MPYITQQRRKELAPVVNPILRIIDTLSKGDINYLITRIVAAKYAKDGYETRSTGTGVFEDAKLEYTRRVVVPYEIKKGYENGDVYTVEDIESPLKHNIVKTDVRCKKCGIFAALASHNAIHEGGSVPCPTCRVMCKL